MRCNCESNYARTLIIKMMAADVLHTSIDNILLTYNDTDSGYYDRGSGASRNTFVCWSAVSKACCNVLERLILYASEMLECDESDIIIDGDFFKANNKFVSKKDISIYLYRIKKDKLVEVVSYSSKVNAGSYGAHFASVKIDKHTGEVKVLEYVAVCDVGKAINPLLLEGQVEGGIMIGLGMALFEGFDYDKLGIVTNANFKKYRLPKMTDVPEIKISLDFLRNYKIANFSREISQEVSLIS